MDIRKQQRAVVDALEDVKAQDIAVYNTEGLTGLFDRVVIATATSNRQTRALAQSVQDKAKELGIIVIAVEGLRRVNGCWWTLAILWCTSCSRPYASTTTLKKSGAASRCA